jgi:hypothetical protein
MARPDPRYKINVFDTILFFASEEGMKPLPNSEAGILLNLVAAVVEYLGGDANKIPEPSYLSFNSGWTGRVNSELDSVLRNNIKSINPSLVEALRDLLSVEWKRDHGESWWESGLRWILMHRQTGIDNVFFLLHPEVIKIQENLKQMDIDTTMHCRSMGLLMREKIIKNLESTQ